MRDDFSYAQTAVFSVHQRVPEKKLRCHLDDLGLQLEIVGEHYDDINRCRQVDPRKNAHGEDVHVEPVIASTLCRGRRGGGVHSGNEHRLMFVREEQSVLNTLASSSVSRTLENNECCCPEQKEISKRRTVLTAPFVTPHREHSNEKRSKTNVSNLMKPRSSSDSPRDRVNDQHSSLNVDPEKRMAMPSLGQQKQVRFQYPPATLPTYWRGLFLPQLPSWEVQQYGHTSPRCVSGCVFENASESRMRTLSIKSQLRTHDRCHMSCDRTCSTHRSSGSWDYPNCSSDSNTSEQELGCSETVQDDTEPMQMACIREYMHYSTMQELEGALTDSDEICPVDEKGWTYEV
jgi:hypothetical protein